MWERMESKRCRGRYVCRDLIMLPVLIRRTLQHRPATQLTGSDNKNNNGRMRARVRGGRVP